MSDDKLKREVEVPEATVSAGGVRGRFVNFVLNNSLLSFVIGLAFVVATGFGLPRITANFTHTAFFEHDDPLLASFNQFERQFGNDDALVLVVNSPSGIFDVDSATLLQELTEQMWLIPEVIRVDSLANYNWVHSYEDDIEVEPLIPDDIELNDELLAERKKIALAHEVLPDYLISEDGKVALVYAYIRPGFEKPPDNQLIVQKTRELIEKVSRTDHEFHLTGGPAINYAFRETSERDSKKLVPMVFLVALLFLLALLRATGGVVMPVIVIVTTIVSALSLAGWLGVELSSITFVLPQILIAVAIADSVHVLTTFYRVRRSGMDRRAAARHTLTKNFVPTILTSISTAAGFFAFSTSELKPIFGLGLLAGLGTLIAWFSTYLLMGPLMVWFPSREKAHNEHDHHTRPSHAMTVFTGWIHRHRWLVLGGFLTMSAAAVGISTTNVVNSDPYKYFAEDYPVREAQDFIIERLSGIAAMEVVVNAGSEDGIKDPVFLNRVEEFERRAAEIDGISKSISIVDIIKQMNRSLHGDDPAHYKLPETKEAVAQEWLLYTMGLPQGMDVNNRVTVKNDLIRLTLISSLSESAAWTAAADRLRKIGVELGLDMVITGKVTLYQSMNGHVVRSFIQSLLIAVVLISLILIIAFRSLRLGLIALLPNLIPLVIGGAVLKMLDHPLDIGTLLVASVCLGIAVDDTIHILANYLRWVREGRSSEEAVAMVLTHTGPALVTTTLVLVTAFGTLAFATFVPNIYFGIMTAVILTTALVTDLTFLPALLMATSKKNEKS